MKEFIYKPIGIIHSPFKDAKGTPIQPPGAKGIKGTIEIEPAFTSGLKDIEGFSHIILLYHFHLSNGYELHTKPFLDDNPRGIFSTRAPKRPNQIGFSIVKLVSIDGSVLHIEDVDIINGTPLLDIKPYVPEFDSRDTKKIGWISKNVSNLDKTKADERFK